MSCSPAASSGSFTLLKIAAGGAAEESPTRRATTAFWAMITVTFGRFLRQYQYVCVCRAARGALRLRARTRVKRGKALCSWAAPGCAGPLSLVEAKRGFKQGLTWGRRVGRLEAMPHEARRLATQTTRHRAMACAARRFTTPGRAPPPQLQKPRLLPSALSWASRIARSG